MRSEQIGLATIIVSGVVGTVSMAILAIRAYLEIKREKAAAAENAEGDDA